MGWRAKGITAPITEAILLIAALSSTIIVVSVVLFNSSFISNRIVEAGLEAGNRIVERIVFVHGVYNSSSECHVIYLKNVGGKVIDRVEASTLIIGNDTYSILLNYNSSVSSGCGCWSFEEAGKADGLWEPSETIIVYACPPSYIKPPYKFIMVLPSGARLQATYQQQG
ncbi:MAG: hypothetical protein ABWW69_00840 [Pyrodictiaceae archaeon]